MLDLRRTYPQLVFVTVSELMQLKAKGWSREVSLSLSLSLSLSVSLHIYTRPLSLYMHEAKAKGWSREVSPDHLHCPNQNP